MNWVDCTVISIQQQTVNLQNEQENEKNRRDEIKIKFHTHSNFHLKPKAQVISCSHDDATNMHRSWLTMKIFIIIFSRVVSLYFIVVVVAQWDFCWRAWQWNKISMSLYGVIVASSVFHPARALRRCSSSIRKVTRSFMYAHWKRNFFTRLWLDPENFHDKNYKFFALNLFFFA